MLSFESVSMYKTVSILLNSFAGAVMLIVLITLLGTRLEKEKGLYGTFLVCLISGIVACILDSISYYMFRQVEYRKAFMLICYFDNLCVTILSFSKNMFIMSYAHKDKAIYAVLRWIVIVIFTGLMIVNLVPPLLDQVIYVPEGMCEIVKGPYYDQYYLGFTICSLLTCIYIALNWKIVGIKESIILFLLQLSPVIGYFVLWDEEPPALVMISLFLLVTYIVLYQHRLLEAMQDKTELMEKKLQLSDMKTKVVLSQVQPHFMYNALSTIAYYCRKDPDKAQKLTIDFSDYLRNNIDTLGGDSIILFSKELEHTRKYLEIEKARFGDRLNVEYDIQDANFAVPALMLQPVVENAVKHGVCKKEDGGTVKISVVKNDDGVIITVSDDGVGFDVDEKKDDGRSHIGIENVRNRLDSICHGHMKIESTPGVGTVVTITIPKEED